MLSSHPKELEDGAVDVEMKARGERVHCGTTSLVGRSDSAYGVQAAGGKCRHDFAIELTSFSLTGPFRVPPWASQFTRKLVEGRLGGEVYAHSEMVGHMALIQDFMNRLGSCRQG